MLQTYFQHRFQRTSTANIKLQRFSKLQVELRK